MSPDHGMLIESAHTRVLRVLVISIGIGSVIFTLLGVGGIIEQHSWLDERFAIAAYLLFCAIPPLLALVASRAPVRVLRIASGVHAVTALVLLALWYPALAPGFTSTTSVPWLTNTIAVATCTAAIAFPAIGAWIYLAVVAVVAGVLRFALLATGDASTPIQDAIMLSLFSIVMVSLVQLTLRSGRQQDDALREAQAEAQASGANETLERQRTRYQEFTQDGVLATLRAASSVEAFGQGIDPQQIQYSAHQALLKMDELRGENATGSALTTDEFQTLLKGAMAGADAGAVPLGITVADQRETRILIPNDVADGLGEALAEAVRNSLQHASRANNRPVLRRVRAAITVTGVEIVVSDDGRGFSLQRIALDRFGVRVGILQRVNALPGARASVISGRREGTTVFLSWNARQWAESTGSTLTAPAPVPAASALTTEVARNAR